MDYEPMKSSLVSDVDGLLAAQAVAWPALARGLQGLRDSQTRVERVFGRDVLVRHIPHRIKSTTAPVDAILVSQRPCFLCPWSLDPEQKGIPANEEFTIYLNPFPILERHLTIVHAEHRHQRIAGQFPALLELAEALPDSFVLYNGPASGASAPDHLHFQSCSRAVFPIERDNMPGHIPRVFSLRDSDAAHLVSRLEALVDALYEVTEPMFEPMINIAALYVSGAGAGWTVFVFPRAKHRPRVYETGELTISPGTIDLCGVLVVPKADDFEKVRGVDIEGIYDEVTLSASQFEAVLARLGGTP
jgi:hypothetical protein